MLGFPVNAWPPQKNICVFPTGGRTNTAEHQGPCDVDQRKVRVRLTRQRARRRLTRHRVETPRQAGPAPRVLAATRPLLDGVGDDTAAAGRASSPRVRAAQPASA